MKNSIKSILLICIISLFCYGCSSKPNINNNKKIITDMAGDEITVPDSIAKVVSLVPYGGQFLVELGFGDYLVAVSDDNVESKWWEVVYPNFNNIKIVNENESAESLINLNPDIVLVADVNQARELRQKGLCAICFQYYSMDEYKQVINMLGGLLGEKVQNKCNQYIKYLESNIKMVEDAFKNKEIKMESVYYINGITNKGLYKTMGKGSTNSALASLSKVIFATDDLIETPVNRVDSEAILAKNPENVIIGGRYQHVLYDELYNSKEWQNISAIKNNHVFKVPIGISAWNRYGLELALMIPWTTAVVYPESFKYDIINETINFYKTFVNYDLSEKEAKYIINGLMPNGEKEIKN